MSANTSRDLLRRTVGAARRRLFIQSCIQTFLSTGLVYLPVAAVVVAFDQWLTAGQWSIVAVVLVGLLWVGTTSLIAWTRMRSAFASALALDEGAALKDRLSSAWEFLAGHGELDEPKMLQIRDAISHAERLNVRSVLRNRFSKSAFAVPALTLLVAASFFIPARVLPQSADASINLRTQQQIDELRSLQEDLERGSKESEELTKVLKELKEIERRFKQGEMAEREVMIELARLDEDLRQSMKMAGVENLENELNQIVPHLMASEAAKQVATAIKEQQLDKAAEEMKKLGDKEKSKELSKEQKEQLAMNMGVAASKLGSKQQASFGGDLTKASESLKSGDSEGFNSASKSMGDKLSSVSKFKNMSQMQKRLSMCKAGLGQKQGQCSACNGSGKKCSSCNGSGLAKSKEMGFGESQGKGKGGLKAGKGTADPLGDPNRLQDSYKKILDVKGQAGQGPVDSEVEVTEGQTSQSQLAAKDVHAEYSAVAEEAMEQEEIPLSHRFHVKRYFQAIRPTE
jgi:hypothetical protein